ncbi:hypothetical protein AGMMS50225_18110 [Betaproteobacteria bacterium]|nr:hypothetical protein AGMMS50225_18110 [Betaproteobacteria bacterium]
MKAEDWTMDKLFSRLIHNRSEKGRWEKVSALWRRPNDEVYSRCVELVHSAKVKERIIGIDVLAQLGGGRRPYGKQTLQLYFKLLEREEDVNAVAAIIHAIGHHNEQGLSLAQIKKLSQYQTHHSSEVRYALAGALSGVDKAPAIDVLIALSRDRSAHVRDWATYYLGQHIETDNEKIREALWQRLNDPDPETRREAICALAQRKGWEA